MSESWHTQGTMYAMPLDIDPTAEATRLSARAAYVLLVHRSIA